MPFDYKSLITFVNDRPGHDFRYAIDNSKIKNDLGWSPKYSFEKGLELTINWYLDNLEWCREISSKSDYRGQRIGIKR